jgi:uncharacterized protein YneF (UPF0154 family)
MSAVYIALALIAGLLVGFFTGLRRGRKSGYRACLRDASGF